MADSTGAGKTRVLILGGGFGGLYAALEFEKVLKRDPHLEVTLVSEDNFSLFTPMLHEVAASDIDLTHIVNPFRKMLRRVNFLEARVEGVDRTAKEATLSYGLGHYQRKVGYDHLLVALGSETNYFGMPGMAEHAVTMKSLGDAVFLRNRMIALLEMASVESDERIRRRMLTFVIGGGGFSGVETIGAMNDFLREATAYYAGLGEKDIRVVLVHPGQWLLPELGEKLGRYTEKKMRERGIEILMETRITGYEHRMAAFDKGEPIEASTLVWTAGVTPAAVVKAFACKQEKGRLVTDEFMELPECRGTWAVGDCAFIPDKKTGKAYPGTAQHALREGRAVARNIYATIRAGRGDAGGYKKKPFVYRNQGQLAAIGRRTGVANVYGFEFSGFLAWWFWRSVYLMKLPRLEKKIRVALDWTLDLFFSKDLVQYITLRDVQAINHLVTARGAGPGDGGRKPMTGSQAALLGNGSGGVVATREMGGGA